MRYSSPAVIMVNILTKARVLAVSNSWEESLENTGGNWGGEDKDDSDYGL